MRKRIKEILDCTLNRFRLLDIPPLSPVRVFPRARDPDWEYPEVGDRVMDVRSDDWDTLSLKASFEQVQEQAQATILRLPLIERATEFGVTVRPVPGNDTYYGYYLIHQREIGLASPEPIVFFHQLAHAAHERLIGRLVPAQIPEQEIVAGMCAQVCWDIIEGNDKFLGNTFRLVARHSFKLNVSTLAGCYQFLTEIQHATRIMLNGDDTSNF